MKHRDPHPEELPLGSRLEGRGKLSTTKCETPFAPGASHARVAAMPMYDDLEPLTDAERELIEKTAKGQDADCRIGDKEADDPAKGAEWGEGRTIRGEIICALLVGDQKK